MKVDISSMLPAEQIETGDPGDKLSLDKLYIEAKKFILSHKWCKKIKNAYVDISYEGIVAVFLFQIEPADSTVDSEIWVITGDLPPAYISPVYAFNGPCALLCYVGEMMGWVKAVKNNENIRDGKYIPVNVPPTLEWANLLGGRLEFIDSNILPEHEDSLVKGGFKRQGSVVPRYTRISKMGNK